jgi:hypothetical protein
MVFASIMVRVRSHNASLRVKDIDYFRTKMKFPQTNGLWQGKD